MYLTKMGNTRFSPAETCKFVDLYRAYECLWDPDNAYYRCKRMHKAACEKIVREMNIEDFSVADVKPKLRSLRGTYNLERQREKKSIQSGDIYVSKLKWLSNMDFIQKLKDRKLAEKNSTIQNADHAQDGIFPENSLCEQSKSNSESECEPSVSNESDLERCIRSITNPEAITVTPEMQALQAEIYGSGPEIQRAKSASNTPLVTVTPEILTLKVASNSETTPVTSGVKSSHSVSNPGIITISPENCRTVTSVSNAAITTVPFGIQTFASAQSPQLFALIPEGQASKSVPNNNYVAITTANNQNTICSGGSETPGSRKRPHEEVSSTDSNNDDRQINNTFDEFNDQIEDELDAFGHFVALNLRKLSMQSALSAQSEILAVLTRYRLNDSTANLPPKQIVPYILTNGSSPAQNSVLFQKVVLKN